MKLFDAAFDLSPILTTVMWPLVILVIIFIFRKPLKKLIDSLSTRQVNIEALGAKISLDVTEGQSNDLKQLASAPVVDPDKISAALHATTKVRRPG